MPFSPSSRRARFQWLAAVVLLVTAAACARPTRDSLPQGEGMLAVPGGRIWYQVVGDGPGTPILAIHGGPGGTSCRMRELSRLAGDRPVIFYDQLGTGRSERPADTTLWVLPRFVAEIDALRSRLGLEDVVLAGFSWGGTVAAEYALARPGTGIRAVILGSPLLSTPAWIADADTLVATLPAEVRRVIRTADSTGRYDTKEYAAAVDSFNVRYLRRTTTTAFPECASVEGNRAIYQYMWGPSEFRSTGTLRGYDRESRLAELQMPVLLIGGEFDEARPPTLRRFQQRIPGSEVVTVPGAAHALLADAPEPTTKAIREFLARRGIP